MVDLGKVGGVQLDGRPDRGLVVPQHRPAAVRPAVHQQPRGWNQAAPGCQRQLLPLQEVGYHQPDPPVQDLPEGDGRGAVRSSEGADQLAKGHHPQHAAGGAGERAHLGLQPEEALRGASLQDDEGHGEPDQGGKDAPGDADEDRQERREPVHADGLADGCGGGGGGQVAGGGGDTPRGAAPGGGRARG